MFTNEQFQQKLKEVNPLISTNTYYNGNGTIMDCICSKGHKYQTKAYNLIYNKNGCPICNGKKVYIGYTDMWSTNPEQASLLLHKEDGYKYTQCSGQNVWWVCPCCGEHLYKKISNVYTKGLSCNKCSDGISFPNRFMYNLLKQMDINFYSESTIDGKNYRYDFYIPHINIIIEMQGKQHYDGWNSKRITKKQIQENDKLKREYAIHNGVSLYIEIDCKESNKNYIKNSIINSELNNYFNFNNIDWNKCCLDSVKSFVYISAEYYNKGMSTSDISVKLGFSSSTIVRWLKLANELNLCNWIPSTGFLEEEKPVIMLNELKIYQSVSEASRDIGQSVQNISDACYGNRKYCGIKNNEPLVWMFLEDYQNENIPKKSTDIYISHNNGIQINQYTLDGTFIKTYNSINEAKKLLGITTITNACSKRTYSAGYYRWYYVDDMNQPDKSKIIGKPRDYGKDKEYTNTSIKTKNLLNNKDKMVYIDCYDRYGKFITTYIGYDSASKFTQTNRDQIYRCCAGKSAYAGDYVFRYQGEDFCKYFYPNEFVNYINVYEKDSNYFIGTYFSLQESLRKLNISSSSSAYKALRKERKYAYGYQFFRVTDPTQPDKSKIITIDNFQQREAS